MDAAAAAERCWVVACSLRFAIEDVEFDEDMVDVAATLARGIE